MLSQRRAETPWTRELAALHRTIARPREIRRLYPLACVKLTVLPHLRRDFAGRRHLGWAPVEPLRPARFDGSPSAICKSEMQNAERRTQNEELRSARSATSILHSQFCVLRSAFRSFRLPAALVFSITSARATPHLAMFPPGATITPGGSNDQRDQTSRRPVVLWRPAPVRLQLIQTAARHDHRL